MFQGCRHIRKPESLAEKATMTEENLSSGVVYYSFKCKKCGREVAHRTVDLIARQR